MNKIKKFLAVTCSLAFLTGWGWDGHKKINENTTAFFPKEMYQFTSWNAYLSQHAGDADNRKHSDPNESKKHFIDIDIYSEFNTTGRIPENYQTIVKTYGTSFVEKQGILPWATITTFDSLKSALQRKDWTKSQFFAADLGHYVGDGHMPLHITKDYNGRNGVQIDIHYRYDDIAKYLPTQIIFAPETAQYVSDVSRFVFDYLYANNRYVDSVYYADSIAIKKTNGQANSAYYNYFWENGKGYTNMLFNRAAKSLASLIYTAWVNAGKPQLSSTLVEKENNAPESFELMQNYPNPFNPETVIKYRINTPGHVRLSLFNVLGKEVATLFDGDRPSGEFSLKVNANSLNIESGIYFYRLEAGSLLETRKMTVLK
ncbi:MAG TPA: S1/P1 nuclease [Ignavibacteriales bacterium]|nr:S1/P1 nuclease [Ignavibacteriales bacterium]